MTSTAKMTSTEGARRGPRGPVGSRGAILVAALTLALALAAPAAARAALESDLFEGPALDGRWTWVDPLGDSTVAVTGGAAVIGVPAGTAHDVWTGANFAPRLLQETDDVDFGVEVKFDTAVQQQYQQQGLVVQQGPDDLLRFEVHFDGAEVRLFAAALQSGVATILHNGGVALTAPVYLRVERVGDTFTFRSSSDGIAWATGAVITHALTVSRVGPFVGNSGSPPPAFTGRIDHFLVDGSPPGSPGGGAEPVGSSTTRTGYCSAPGNTVRGAPVRPGTFLNLLVGQPRSDPAYMGAIPAPFFEGVGLTCDRARSGYVPAGGFVDGLGARGGPDAVHERFVRGG